MIGSTALARRAGSQAATPANQSFLQGPWSGSSNQDKDPSGRLNLGTYGSQPSNFIFFRENY